MTACRARSSGSPSSRSRSVRSGQGLGSRSAARRASDEVRPPGPTVVIRAASSSDILHAVGVLELLHERVEVERVRLEVLLEARLLLDARRVELELVGQVRADGGEDLFAGHGSATVAAGVGRRSAPRRSAPAASSARVRAADDVARARRARRARSRARSRARRTSRAGRRRAAAARAGTRRPAPRGRARRAARRSAGRSSSPPALARALDIAASRIAPSSAADVPSIDLEHDVAGEAVGDDDVGLAACRRRSPRRCRRSPARRRRAAPRARRRRPPCPCVGSVPLDSSATRGRSTPDTACMNAAPMWANWTRCSGRTSTLAPRRAAGTARPGPARAARAPAGGRRARA